MKIIRLRITDTFEAIEQSESIAFDIQESTAERLRYSVVLQGFENTDRFCVVMHDREGTVIEISQSFAVTQEQLEKIQDLTMTIELECPRLPGGSFRVIRLADLVAAGTTTGAQPS